MKLTMLHHTFIHLPHIGPLTERRLWANNILKWRDLLNEKNELANKFSHLRTYLSISEKKLKALDANFFTKHLGTDQHWRIFSEFSDVSAYLDIETTGLGGPGDYITTISLYDGKKIYYYIHDKNMEQFLDDIKKYKVLVTYNGKCFDVPFIEREFGISLPHAHLDLRYILRSLGFTGGLKSCEHQLGISRGELEGIDGYFAVFLWRDYLAGNRKALETLLAYNIEDTVNLEKLMVIAFNKKVQSLPVAIQKKSIVKLPRHSKQLKIPFKPDNNTIKRIKAKYY